MELLEEKNPMAVEDFEELDEESEQQRYTISATLNGIIQETPKPLGKNGVEGMTKLIPAETATNTGTDKYTRQNPAGEKGAAGTENTEKVAITEGLDAEKVVESVTFAPSKHNFLIHCNEKPLLQYILPSIDHEVLAEATEYVINHVDSFASKILLLSSKEFSELTTKLKRARADALIQCLKQLRDGDTEGGGELHRRLYLTTQGTFYLHTKNEAPININRTTNTTYIDLARDCVRMQRDTILGYKPRIDAFMRNENNSLSKREQLLSTICKKLENVYGRDAELEWERAINGDKLPTLAANSEDSNTPATGMRQILQKVRIQKISLQGELYQIVMKGKSPNYSILEQYKSLKVAEKSMRSYLELSEQ